MKKRILILVISILVLSIINSAIADEFTLRNGVKFGDSMDDVKSKETLNLSSFSGDTFLRYEGTLAGISGGMLFYHFDSELKLNDVEYRYSGLLEREIKEYYPLLLQGLEDKYGAPLENKDGTMYPITTGALETIDFYVALGKQRGDAGYDDYAEWVVDVDDYYVKIDLISYHAIAANGNLLYGIGIGYRVFTEKEKEELTTNISTDEL